jgi:hypothetical protein
MGYTEGSLNHNSKSIIRKKCNMFGLWCLTVCQWLAAGRWFSPGILVSSTNEIDRHDVTERLLKVALNTITQTYYISFWWWTYYYDLNFPQCSPFNPKWDQDVKFILWRLLTRVLKAKWTSAIIFHPSWLQKRFVFKFMIQKWPSTCKQT